jgi:hypothetical protein
MRTKNRRRNSKQPPPLGVPYYYSGVPYKRGLEDIQGGTTLKPAREGKLGFRYFFFKKKTITYNVFFQKYS